jgi:hypothetical protein
LFSASSGSNALVSEGEDDVMVLKGRSKDEMSQVVYSDPGANTHVSPLA